MRQNIAAVRNLIPPCKKNGRKSGRKIPVRAKAESVTHMIALSDAIHNGAHHDDKIHENQAHSHKSLRGGMHGTFNELGKHGVRSLSNTCTSPVRRVI